MLQRMRTGSLALAVVLVGTTAACRNADPVAPFGDQTVQFDLIERGGRPLPQPAYNLRGGTLIAYTITLQPNRQYIRTVATHYDASEEGASRVEMFVSTGTYTRRGDSVLFAIDGWPGTSNHELEDDGQTLTGPGIQPRIGNSSLTVHTFRRVGG